MKKRLEYILLPCFIALGFILGVLSKAGDVAVQGFILGNILNAFGRVSSGVFIWVVICTAITSLSKSKIWSIVNVFFFLASMILAYYLYSYFIVNYFVLRIVRFWLAMLIPSMLLSFILWNIRTIRILKYIVIITGTFIMIYDMFITQGALPIAIIIDLILYGIFLAFIIKRKTI